MKQYEFKLEVFEQNDEFWEELEDQNKTGCDEINKIVNEALQAVFLSYRLKLVKYENNSSK
jgi:hypothetical protein